MTRTACDDFREDPARFDRHPEECGACRALVDELEQLDGEIASGALEPETAMGADLTDSLPLAAWEGASYRSWWIAAGVAALIALIGSLAFWSIGIPPIRGFARVIESEAGTGLGLIDIARASGELVQNAPARFHLVIGIGFVAINILFAWLLRRAPRGIDVRAR